MFSPVQAGACAILQGRAHALLRVPQVQWAKNVRGLEIPRQKHNPARAPSPDSDDVKIIYRRIIVSPGGEWSPEQGREWGELFQGDGVDDIWGVYTAQASHHQEPSNEDTRCSTLQSSANTPVAHTGINHDAPVAVSPLITSMCTSDAADVDIEIGGPGGGMLGFEMVSGSSDLFLVPEYQYQSMLHRAHKSLEYQDAKAKALSQGVWFLMQARPGDRCFLASPHLTTSAALHAQLKRSSTQRSEGCKLMASCVRVPAPPAFILLPCSLAPSDSQETPLEVWVTRRCCIFCCAALMSVPRLRVQTRVDSLLLVQYIQAVTRHVGRGGGCATFAQVCATRRRHSI